MSKVEKLVAPVEEEPSITIDGTTHLISELSDKVRELLSLHEQAVQMAVGAKRQAVIHDMAVANIVSFIQKEISDPSE
jgi:hypothetical protein